MTLNVNDMPFIWITSWVKQAFTWFIALSSLGLAYFLPVGGLVGVAITIIFLDFLVGTLVSIKLKIPIESKRAWRTPYKLLVAIGMILGFHVVHQVMIEPLPDLPLIGSYIENLSLSYLVTFSIIWAELVSISEKIKMMFGWNILDLIKIRFGFLLKKKENENNEGV
jgi:hypothetical protein